MGNNPMSEAAKELRQRQTEAEKRLWFKLRDAQLYGTKFRRQEPIGNYIADFVCFEKKLVIEIDGNPHKQADVKRKGLIYITSQISYQLWLTMYINPKNIYMEPGKLTFTTI